MSELDYNGCVHRTSPEGPYDYSMGFRFTCAPSRDRADQCISALESTPVSVRTELVSECDWCT